MYKLLIRPLLFLFDPEKVHYFVFDTLKFIHKIPFVGKIIRSIYTVPSKKLELNHFVFKNIYTSNKDKYLAILAKHNKLPKNYQINISQTIEDCVLKEEIESLR